MTTEIKTFRVTGYMKKPKKKIKFTQETRALKMDSAVFKVLETLGSRHKLKQKMIEITKVEEIKPEESRSQLIQQLGEDA